jgi:hypothetical protein
VSPSNIHHLNSALMVISCLVAFFIPFELFLFSYAILGPLHYLTEIGWLHKKNYFTKGKNDFIFLIIGCVLIVYWNYFPIKNYTRTADVLLFCLFLSIVFVFIKDWLYRWILILLSVIIIGVLNNSPQYFTWFGIFLPTIIHVFIFTWVFMLYGVIKEKSIPGLISIAVLILCTVLLFIIQPTNLIYKVSEYTMKSYGGFSELNFRLINFLNLSELTEVKQIFTTQVGFVIMRFIAFAYTYHYLNWFSKTSVIKWHLVPKKTLFITLIIWILSISIYFYDYTLGLQVLLFLSFLHVFLEFPLNVMSFTGIGKELSAFNIKKTK